MAARAILSLIATFSAIGNAETVRCCQTMTVECVACNAGQSPEDFFHENPSFSGCDKYKVPCKCGPEPTPDLPPCHDPPDCVRNIEHITHKAQCKWFMEESTIRVENLKIIRGDAGEKCNFKDVGTMHHTACGACAMLHQPCDGIFAACPDCCFTGGPGPMEDIMCERVPQHHNCDDFQSWFFDQNVSLNCTDTVSLDHVAEDGSLIPNKINVEIKQPLAQGTLQTTCQWTKTEDVCPAVPVKVRLDCTDCAIKAVPDLLQQCCDLGVQLATGQVMQDLRDQGLAPQLWIDGCHDPHLHFDYYPYSVPFPNHTKYADFTEERANERLKESVEQNYCAKGLPEDPQRCADHSWQVVNRDNPKCKDYDYGRRLEKENSSDVALFKACVKETTPEASQLYQVAVTEAGTFKQVQLEVNTSGFAVIKDAPTSTTTTTVRALASPSTSFRNKSAGSEPSSSATKVTTGQMWIVLLLSSLAFMS